MLLYLDLAYTKARREGRLESLGDLQAAILDGAVKRIRPKFMTVACVFLGLFPSFGRRHGLGRDETYCGSDDRRDLYVVLVRAGGLSGDL